MVTSELLGKLINSKENKKLADKLVTDITSEYYHNFSGKFFHFRINGSTAINNEDVVKEFNSLPDNLRKLFLDMFIKGNFMYPSDKEDNPYKYQKIYNNIIIATKAFINSVNMTIEKLCATEAWHRNASLNYRGYNGYDDYINLNSNRYY